METKRKLSVLFHILVLLVHAFTFYYEFAFLSWPGRTIGDRFLKLTTYNFVLSTIYWIFRLLENFTDVSKIIRTKQFLLSTILPLSTMVFIMFWAIFLYNPNLLRSPELKKYIDQGLITVPPWIIHTYHTAIILFPVFDLLFYPKSAKTGSDHVKSSFSAINSVKTFCFLSLLYFIGMMGIGLAYNKWPYPMLASMTMVNRLALGLTVLVAGSSLSYCFTVIDQRRKHHAH